MNNENFIKIIIENIILLKPWIIFENKLRKNVFKVLFTCLKGNLKNDCLRCAFIYTLIIKFWF